MLKNHIFFDEFSTKVYCIVRVHKNIIPKNNVKSNVKINKTSHVLIFCIKYLRRSADQSNSWEK